MTEPHGQLTAPNQTSQGIVQVQGEIQVRIAVLWFIGIACGLLIIGGFSVILIRPELTKDVWVIIGPIISAAITGTVGFLAGQSSSKG